MTAAPQMLDESRRKRLGQLFSEHVDFVWRSLRRLGLRDDQADDGVQEVFLVVRRRLDDLREDSSVRSWLYAICWRVASERRRKDRRRDAREQRVADLRIAPSQPDDPEEAAARREASRLVDDFVAGLDEKRRTAFVLYELEGMSGRQIAEATGWKLNTVFTRLKAARKKFEAFAEKVAAQ